MNLFGDWFLVITSILLFTAFILAFIKPIRKRDWKSLSLYEAFIVSLFTEMFGIPLTIYILSSLGLPLVADPLQGHLLAALLALVGVWDLETGVTVVMVVSLLMLLLGGYLVVTGWRQIYSAGEPLVTNGLYGVVRHPQYLGIIIGTAAFLIQWPTIITVAMWPILTYAYYRQAKREEEELQEKFGEEYCRYKESAYDDSAFEVQIDTGGAELTVRDLIRGRDIDKEKPLKEGLAIKHTIFAVKLTPEATSNQNKS